MNVTTETASHQNEQGNPRPNHLSTQNLRLSKSAYAKMGVCMLLVGLAMGASDETNASEFSYNEIEMSLTPDAIDGADPTLSFSGSYEVINNISLIGSYSRTTLAESRGIEVEFVTTQLGAAYHYSLQRKTDFVADISYVETQLIISDGSRSASLGEGSGYRIGAGVRHQYTDRIELHTTADYLSVESATDTALTVGGHYFFTKKLSAGVGYTTGEFDGVAASIRMSF